MELGFVHILSLIATLAVVLGCGIYSSRKVKSADDFDVGGRSAGVIMVAGSIAATIIGGAATIGTAQGGFTKDIKNVSFFAKQVAKAIIMY